MSLIDNILAGVKRQSHFQHEKNYLPSKPMSIPRILFKTK